MFMEALIAVFSFFNFAKIISLIKQSYLVELIVDKRAFFVFFSPLSTKSSLLEKGEKSSSLLSTVETFSSASDWSKNIR